MANDAALDSEGKDIWGTVRVLTVPHVCEEGWTVWGIWGLERDRSIFVDSRLESYE